MTAITNTFEGGTDGVTVTTGNSGGASGTAFDDITIGGASTLTYENSHVANGAMGCRILTVSGTSVVLEHNAALGTQTSVWGRFYLYLGAIPTKTTVLARLRTGTTGAAFLRLKTAAKIELLDTASTPQNTSTTVLSAATLYRIEWRVVCSTTVGSIECKIFDSPQSTTPIETFSASNINTQASVDEYSIGPTNSPASVVDMFVDEIEWNNTGYPGPSTTGAAITPALQTLSITRPAPTVTGTGGGGGSFTGWTWNPGQPWSSGGATALAVDPIVPGRLFISEDVGGLRRSDDYGATWRMFQAGIYDEETRRKCATVNTYLDPNRPGHTLTVAGFGNNNNGGTAEFEDDDDQWRRLNTGVRFNSQNDTITPGLSNGKPRTNKKLITVSSDGFIYAAEYGTNQIKRKPAGSGTTWTTIATNVGATIRSIASDPDDPSRLYFGVYSEGGSVYGLNLITDPADTPSAPTRITPTRAAGGPETVEMIAFEDGIIYLACGDDGVWRSGSGSGSGGTLLVTPTQTAKLGSSWFVNNPDARKYAGRIENEAMVLAGGYYYVGTLGADLARTVAGVDLTGRNGLFRINATTLELDTSFNPAFTPDASTDGVSGTGLEIHAATTNGTDVVIGGNFTSVDGQTRAGICAFDAVTGVLTSKFSGFTLTGGSATIYSAHFDATAPTTLYIGGSFTSVNGTARNRAAALTYSSLAVTSFNPNCSTTVRSIKPWHSGATTRVAICMDPQGNIAGVGPYSVASVSSTGALVWGKNPSTGTGGEGGGGYVMDVTDYVGSGGPYLVHGCVGQIDTGGNTAYLYDWTGTQLWFSGSNGDVQACAFYQGGKSEPVVMLGFHDNTVCAINSTTIPGATNALGFWSVSLAGVIDTGTFRPSFGQDTSVSGSAASYGGGTLKVWGLYADETNNRLLVGGDFTQVKTQPTGGTTVSPAPRRLAIYNEASTTPSGWESINTGLPASSRYVMCLGVRATGANHTLIVGLHAPGSANRSVWRTTNANAATAGAVSWSGIADSAIDNNYDSGVDTYAGTIATGNNGSIFAIEPDPHSTAGSSARWYMMTGPGSWFYVSNDNGLTWTMSVEGLTICSHNWVSVASDGRMLFGNQDHDQFASTDWGQTVTRVEPPNTSDVSIGNVTFGPDYLDAWWGADNPDSTTTNGYLTSGGEPATQSAIYIGTGGESIQAVVVGQVNGNRRLVAYRNGKGVFRTPMPNIDSVPNWSICTGTPTNLLTLTMTTPNVPMVWPDPTGSENIYWFLRAGTGSGGGVWMSPDAGVTCSRILSLSGGGTRRGYVAASNDSPNVVYCTTDAGDPDEPGSPLRRIRNPGAGNQAVDVIGGVENAAAIWFDIDDNLLVYCLPTATKRPRLLRAEAPVPTTGSITFLDVLDPTVVGGAVDSSGQDSLLNVNSLNGDNEHIVVVINGASFLMGTQVTSGDATVTPSLRTLTITPQVPAVVGVDPSQALQAQRQTMTITPTAPTVGLAVAPALQSLTLSLGTPGLINATAVSVAKQSLTISPITPAAIAQQNVAVPVVGLTISPFAPAVSGGGGSRPVWMAFGPGSDEWYYERGNLT